MLNPQLQFHLETFSSESDATEGQGEPERSPLKDDKQEPQLADLQKAKSASDCDSYPGSYVSLALSFVAGVIAQTNFQGFIFMALIICLSFAATKAVLNTVKKRKLARKRSMLQRTRQHISQALCSMGAPPLNFSLETRKIPSAQQLHSLASMTSTFSEWIHTVDKVLEFLQASTSIKLGLGTSSVSVGRIERASLRKAKLPYTTLSNLRRRLLGKMIQINTLLLETCEMEYVYDVDDFDSGVVTLQALKLVRHETAFHLSRVLNHSLASPVADSAVESLCLVVSEAIAYFSGIFDLKDIIPNDCVDNQLRGRIRSILTDVHGLQTCLQASCETASSEHKQCDLQDFFDEAKSFLEKILTAVETLRSVNALDNDASVLAHVQVSKENVQRSIPDSETSQVFLTESDRGAYQNVLREQAKDSVKTNRVLVFSGRGEVKIKAKKPEKVPSTKDESNYNSFRYQNMENKLLAELQKHLNSIPKRIEEDVCVERTDQFDGHQESSPRPYASVSSETNEGVGDIFSRRVLDGDFLPELTKQIPILCSSDELDDVVADNHGQAFH